MLNPIKFYVQYPLIFPPIIKVQKKQVGYYKDGKYEVQNFKLNSEIVITKKKDLRLGHMLIQKDRPVIVY
ncbi:unnamed protein product [Commensalibacter communis]|nr:unnamed protein product [Commensalibacter communis]CAI3954902.1 unnamed protein product [Commensalibacter communis]